MLKSPVSICLTSYNRAAHLPATLDSLLEQDWEDFELIINDDCSSDGASDVCREYELRDSRVKFFKNPRQLRMPGNLNAAIRRSTGAIVANVHDGDVYRKDMLSKCCGLLEEDPETAFVFNQYESEDEHGRRILHAHPFPVRFEVGELTNIMLRDLTSPVWGTVVARRSCYECSGLFNPRFSYYSDVEMWMRLNLTYRVGYVPEPLMFLHRKEADRPYARIDWRHEQILLSIHEEIIQRLYADDAVAAAKALRRLRKIRNRRWPYQLSCLLAQGRARAFYEGLELCRLEDSFLMKSVGVCGLLVSPLLRLGKYYGT